MIHYSILRVATKQHIIGYEAIKNDYDTNVMYDIANVAGKLQIYVSHHPIDLSTVLIPNDGSLEESFADRIHMNLLDRVSQLYWPFSLLERLKADNTSYLRLTLEGFPFVTVNTRECHSECSDKISRIMRRTL
ncbi:hypothetical protein Tco_1275095 [Tanacetum coccineum]